MAKNRSKKKRRVNDDTLVRNLYAVIFIVLSVIALLHDYTGFLGGILCKCTRFMFGYIWFIPYLVLMLIGLLLLMNKSVTMNKYFIAAGLLFFAGLFACSIPADISVKGNEIFDGFILNAKAIFNGDAASKGGLIGTILYAIFSQLIDFVGTMIIMGVLVIAAIVVFFSDGTFNKIVAAFKNTKKVKKPIKKINKTSPIKKNGSAFIDIDKSKSKKLNFLNKEKKDKKNISPFIKNSDITPKQTIPVKKEEEKAVVKKVEPTVEKQQTVQMPTVTASTKTNPSLANYVPPRTMLLDAGVNSKGNVNKRSAVEKWNSLERILDDFDLPSELSAYNIGPSVTQFEIVPMGNFNIKKYATIQENIKMAMAVRDIRIEAPIPGKSAVGIEIPNEERVMVKLRELLDNIPNEHQSSNLIMALGKDLGGNRVYGRIDKMPHLLIAGSTGSGKSVCINSIILSILYRARPDEVKLIMVDPKKVEFTPYTQIPHLACPIINDTTKAAETLKKLVMLMEQRYDTLSKTGCRNIGEYNNKFADKKMCNIVCIIDELADLMATHGKEVEQYIARLAAMARASGIYMILATQRPSTDVITGTIKNNIPSRISFAVGSSIDSRTILDRTGAESLLGNGDMLYMPQGSNSPIRLQGVYVSDSEIEKVTKYFVDSHFIPQYEDIFIIDENAEDGGTGAAICEDPLYEDIKKWVCTLTTISASGLQRRYGLGFPRAAKLIDALEQDGVISGSNGSKPRDVLVKQVQE